MPRLECEVMSARRALGSTPEARALIASVPWPPCHVTSKSRGEVIPQALALAIDDDMVETAPPRAFTND